MCIRDRPRGGVILADTDQFTKRNLAKVGYTANPLEDDSLDAYRVHALPLTTMTVEALADSPLTRKEKERAKNMFALGLLEWMYSRNLEGTKAFLESKFAKKPDILRANVVALELSLIHI